MTKKRVALGILGGAVGLICGATSVLHFCRARSDKYFLRAFGTDLHALGVWYYSRLEVVSQKVAPSDIEPALYMELPSFTTMAGCHVVDADAKWVRDTPFNTLQVTVVSVSPLTLALLADALLTHAVPGIEARSVRYHGSSLYFSLVVCPDDDPAYTQASDRHATS